jgi:hypothetical protein
LDGCWIDKDKDSFYWSPCNCTVSMVCIYEYSDLGFSSRSWFRSIFWSHFALFRVKLMPWVLFREGFNRLYHIKMIRVEKYPILRIFLEVGIQGSFWMLPSVQVLGPWRLVLIYWWHTSYGIVQEWLSNSRIQW